MRALTPEHEREPIPPAFLDGAWINAQPPPTLERLQGSATLIIRFQAADPVTTAFLRYAQTHAPSNGAKALGLHVPQEPYEAKHRTVRNTVLRDGLTVPIRQDPGGMRAKALSLHNPADILILDAQARIAARHPGPPSKEILALAQAFKPSTSHDTTWKVRGHAPPPTPLLYPQGLASQDATLAIADTAHHRVLHEHGGDVRSFGTGAPGHQDGTLEEACFLRPHGILIQGDLLIVADTGNGALRRVHPDEGTVDTIVDEHDLGEGTHGALGPMPRDLAAHPYHESVVVASLTGEGGLVSVDLEEGTARPVPDMGGLDRPVGVASNDAFVFVSEPREGRIVRVDPENGDSETLLSDEGAVVAPAGLDHGDGVLAIADPFAGGLHRFDTKEERLIDTVASFGPADPLVEPWAIAVREEGALLTVGDEHRLVEATASGSRGVPALEDRLGDGGVSRLDPVEVAPGGRLRLDVMLRGDGSSPDGGPRVRGPVRVGSVGAVEKRGGAWCSRVEVDVLASGRVEASWGTRGAWSLPVLVRPGGRGVETVQVTSWGGAGLDDEQSP